MGGMNLQNNGLGNANQMAAMLNNQSQMGGMNNLKRLQQLQQQLQNNTPNNPLLVQQAQQDPSAAILQSYLDQKIQSSRFDDSLRTQLGMGGIPAMNQGNPMLGSNLLQERFMMNQNGMGGMKAGGSDMPLP